MNINTTNNSNNIDTNDSNIRKNNTQCPHSATSLGFCCKSELTSH